VRRVWRSGWLAWLVLHAAAGCASDLADAARDGHGGAGGTYDAGALAPGDAGAGGEFGGGMDGSVPATVDRSVVECNDTAAVTSCGGVSCPAPDPFAAQSCQLVCCTTEGLCGLRAADDGVCTVQPDSGGGCPGATLDLGLGSEVLSGCCTPSGTCGAIAFGECLPRERLELAVMPCEVDDAGVDDDAGSEP